MITIIRFLIVGFCNTLVGYAIILLALAAGAGDYGANALGYAIGLPISYFMHRFWTFQDRSPATFAQGARFAVAVLIAYGANVGVVWTARSLGYVENVFAQALAVGTYAVLFFFLSRFLVFRGLRLPNTHGN